MTSYLIDINVWLALTWDRHPHSGQAAEWFNALPTSQVRLLFCRITQLALLRLLTNQTVMREDVLHISQALELLDRWFEDPRVEFAAEPPGVEASLRGALTRVGPERATKAIMDAYLAAFAEMQRATLVTFDKALYAMARERRTRSIRLPHQ